MADTKEKLTQDLLNDIRGKHCNCCDWSKHYYDEDIEKAIHKALSQLQQETEKEMKDRMAKKFPEHWWIYRTDLLKEPADFCMKCGVVRRRDKKVTKCKGWVQVSLRSLPLITRDTEE